MNAIREHVSKCVTGMIDALDQAGRILVPSYTSIEQVIETLSKVRNKGKAKKSMIFLDLKFTIPQIGEVIRDLLALHSIASSVEQERDMQEKMIASEADAAHIQSLLLLKHSSALEQHLTSMVGYDGKNLVDKYEKLTDNLVKHGADFIITLDDISGKKKKKSPNSGGYFTSLEDAPT